MSYLDYFLELLKIKLINTGFVKEDEIKNYGVSCERKNFFTGMSNKTKEEYKNGDGKELESGDFKRIRSSAAMIFNLLGNEEVVIKSNSYLPSGKYKKEFEKKLKTVKRSGKKANLDAWLYNETCEVFIESKCLEWLQRSNKPLKEAYTKNTTRYYFPETAELFREIGNEILLSQYDSCQMFRHTLAIYNYLKDSKNQLLNKKIYLVNVVWEPDEKELPEEIRLIYRDQLSLEHSEFGLFYKKMKPIIDEINKLPDITFDIIYLSVKDFYSMLVYSDEEQKAFVQRYL